MRQCALRVIPFRLGHGDLIVRRVCGTAWQYRSVFGRERPENRKGIQMQSLLRASSRLPGVGNQWHRRQRRKQRTKSGRSNSVFSVASCSIKCAAISSLHVARGQVRPVRRAAAMGTLDNRRVRRELGLRPRRSFRLLLEFPHEVAQFVRPPIYDGLYRQELQRLVENSRGKFHYAAPAQCGHTKMNRGVRTNSLPEFGARLTTA
jgi:hypothetical protein